LSRLTADTEVVTLTIGGNDAGFEAILRRCVNHPRNSGWGCSKDKELQKGITQRFVGLMGKPGVINEGRPVHALSDIFQRIQELAPKAKIYIAGYPKLFGEHKEHYTQVKNAPGHAACFIPVLASVSYQDALWLNKQSEKLDDLIQDQVKKARDKGVRVNYVSDLFAGHALCDESSAWLNGVIFGEDKLENVRPESFHPTADGIYLGYDVAFEIALRRG
jgi:hypothetical protein